MDKETLKIIDSFADVLVSLAKTDRFPSSNREDFVNTIGDAVGRKSDFSDTDNYHLKGREDD